MKKNIITGLVLLVWGSVFYSCTSEKTVQADFDIIPLPQHVEKISSDKGFELAGTTSIVYPEGDEAMKRNAEFLSGYIAGQTGKKLDVTDKKVEKNAIVLSTGLDDKNPEAYRLVVGDNNISIQGASAAGVFYGI